MDSNFLNKSNEEIKEYIDNQLYKLAFDSAKKGNIEIIKYLFNINTKYKYGQTISSLACNNGNFQFVRWLIEEQNLKISVGTLFKACRSGNLELVRYLLEEKNNLSVDGTGNVLMIYSGEK